MIPSWRVRRSYGGRNLTIVASLAVAALMLAAGGVVTWVAAALIMG